MKILVVVECVSHLNLLAWFRLFVGDLSNDVSDDVLTNAFNKYTSFTKARVIRDRLSQKAKYGFVAFSDPEDFLKAWKEMDGKPPLSLVIFFWFTHDFIII